MRIILGMTGASGVVYGLRLLNVLQRTDHEIHVVMSSAWHTVARQELGQQYAPPQSSSSTVIYDPDDFSAAISSGSAEVSGMIIAPCSGSSLGCIAAGVNRHLIHRAAEVQLKEHRRLILLVRESPLSLIHLQNMERVTLAGGIIQPASPHFYHVPQTVHDMVDSVVARTLDLIGVKHELGKRWK
ncbi:MAG: UbiX family flavin prenyltransferase [Planctomycetaceae bacterium]|jgi:4-hydroxy-3-polyprenylbenzoate decarboxylase|nr:UbiX family flavin prenyltransferase [Planctomycetaceae bacterium]